MKNALNYGKVAIAALLGLALVATGAATTQNTYKHYGDGDWQGYADGTFTNNGDGTITIQSGNSWYSEVLRSELAQNIDYIEVSASDVTGTLALNILEGDGTYVNTLTVNSNGTTTKTLSDTDKASFGKLQVGDESIDGNVTVDYVKLLEEQNDTTEPTIADTKVYHGVDSAWSTVYPGDVFYTEVKPAYDTIPASVEWNATHVDGAYSGQEAYFTDEHAPYYYAGWAFDEEANYVEEVTYTVTDLDGDSTNVTLSLDSLEWSDWDSITDGPVNTSERFAEWVDSTVNAEISDESDALVFNDTTADAEFQEFAAHRLDHLEVETNKEAVSILELKVTSLDTFGDKVDSYTVDLNNGSNTVTPGDNLTNGARYKFKIAGDINGASEAPQVDSVEVFGSLDSATLMGGAATGSFFESFPTIPGLDMVGGAVDFVVTPVANAFGAVTGFLGTAWNGVMGAVGLA